MLNLIHFTPKILFKTAVFVLFGGIVAAQDLASDSDEKPAPPPFVDFSPKFGKAPKQGESGKIDIQIAPVIQTPTVANALPGKRSVPTGSYHWFWETIPPTDRQGVFASDFGPALDLISSRDEGKAIVPRLNDMQTLLRLYQRHLLMASVRHSVSPPLLASVIYVESGGDPNAVSGSNAQGLMQLPPATADRFDVSDPFDPAQNIMGGAEYLSWLIAEFDGDVISALAGYNAGENRIKRAGGVPDIEETRGYVPKVLAAYLIARSFCKTPPVMVTDGCVFNVN